MANPVSQEGLSSDVLMLVAAAGGSIAMKAMRGVNKTWRAGYDLQVRFLKVNEGNPALPLQRIFPALTHLDIGGSTAEESWLENLGAFPKLDRLVLGLPDDKHVPGSLSSQLTEVGFGQLWGLQLRDLNLEGCHHIRSLAPLSGMPLSSLVLAACHQVEPGELGWLRGMPLTKVDLRGWYRLLSGAGVQQLLGLPLTHLSLFSATETKLKNANLEVLEEMPLTSLSLMGNSRLTDAGVLRLRGLSLVRLSLSSCVKITDESLGYLREMPLTSLGLGACDKLTDAGLRNLRNLPLTSLNIRSCTEVTDAGLAWLRGMQLSTLSVGQCWRITDVGMAHLEEMPLTRLDLAGCFELSAECRENFAASEKGWTKWINACGMEELAMVV